MKRIETLLLVAVVASLVTAAVGVIICLTLFAGAGALLEIIAQLLEESSTPS